MGIRNQYAIEWSGDKDQTWETQESMANLSGGERRVPHNVTVQEKERVWQDQQDKCAATSQCLSEVTTSVQVGVIMSWTSSSDVTTGAPTWRASACSATS